MVKKGRDKKRLKEAVVFILWKDRKFLLEERVNPEKSYFGYMKVPGGKVEEGEAPQAALTREIKEELGVKADSFVLLDSYENVTTLGVHFLVHVYFVTRFGGEVKNREPYNSRFIWLTFKSALKTVKCQDSKYILFLAERFIKQSSQKG